ncbi:MAG: hypothetical protein ACLR9H_02295, partial [Bifidobacterium breve]
PPCHGGGHRFKSGRGRHQTPDACREFFCFLPFFDAIRKDGESECIRFDTPSTPMPALREAPVCSG